MRTVPRSRVKVVYLALQRRNHNTNTLMSKESLDDALRRATHLKCSHPPSPALRPMTTTIDQRCAVWLDLLSAFAKNGMIAESMATLDDIRACHVPFNVKMLDFTLEAAVKANNVARINEVLQRYMSLPKGNSRKPLASGILPHDFVCHWSPATVSHLLQHCARTQNLEYMVILVMTAGAYGIHLTDKSLSFIVQCFSDAREPRLAWDLIQQVDQIRKLPAFIWMRVLRVCAQHDFGPALSQAWHRSVVEGKLELDHGLVAQVLLTASRAGLDGLVDKVLQCIKEPDEMILVPAMDAYIEASRYNDVFDVLSRMNELQIPPQPAILAHLTSMVSSDNDTLQSACSALLRHNKPVCSEVWNALIYATAHRKDVRMSEKLVQLMPTPTLDTYQAWLLCCVNARDVDAGKKAWSALQQETISASSICYERMIRLHLTEPTYEEAFRLLEEAKHLHLVPTRRTYASMIWTCLQCNDERWCMLLKEMREANYEPGERLREILNINTTTATPAA